MAVDSTDHRPGDSATPPETAPGNGPGQRWEAVGQPSTFSSLQDGTFEDDLFNTAFDEHFACADEKFAIACYSCRTCSSLASFTSQTKNLKAAAGGGAAAAAGAATATAAAASSLPDDCPADVETLGRSTWTLLHSMAATYPERPTAAEQADLRTFMGAFSRLYPCWVCAEDLQAYMRREQLRVGGRDEFGRWLCEAHNAVNRKLGKPNFDCNTWEERWRTGWKDGRCG